MSWQFFFIIYIFKFTAPLSTRAVRGWGSCQNEEHVVLLMVDVVVRQYIRGKVHLVAIGRLPSCQFCQSRGFQTLWLTVHFSEKNPSWHTSEMCNANCGFSSTDVDTNGRIYLLFVFFFVLFISNYRNKHYSRSKRTICIIRLLF